MTMMNVMISSSGTAPSLNKFIALIIWKPMPPAPAKSKTSEERIFDVEVRFRKTSRIIIIR